MAHEFPEHIRLKLNVVNTKTKSITRRELGEVRSGEKIITQFLEEYDAQAHARLEWEIELSARAHADLAQIYDPVPAEYVEIWIRGFNSRRGPTA